MQFKDIDKIFVISLNGSERMADTDFELKRQNIEYVIYPAIKSRNGSDGLKESFRLLFSHCIEQEYKRVLVFEDDIELTNFISWKKEADKILQDLPEKFHLFKFGANLLLPIEQISKNISKLKMSYALHATLYSEEGMRAILKLLNDPIDVLIAKYIEPLGNCYVSNTMMATQRPTKSGIFVYDEEKHSNLKYYEKDTGIIRWDLLMQDQWDRNTKHLKI